MQRNIIAGGLWLAVGLSGCGGWLGESDDVPLPGERQAVRPSSQPLYDIVAPETDFTITTPAARARADWPQVNGGPARAPGNAQADLQFVPIWRADIGRGDSSSGRIVSTPIVAGGRVYALDAASRLTAVDAATGSEAWRFDLTPPGENRADGFGGGLAAAGGVVFASTGFGEVVAVNADGVQVWRAPLGSPARAAPAVSGGRVYAVTRDNRVVALNAADGAQVWSETGIAGGAGILGGAAPAAADGVVIAPFASGEVVALDAARGRVLWSDSLSGRGGTALGAINDVSGDPVIAGGAVFASAPSGRTVAIDARSGERLWTQQYGSSSPALAVGETVYLSAADGAIIALSAQSGAAIWSLRLPAWRDPEDRSGPIRWRGPIMVDDALIVVSSAGDLLTIDARKGEVLREVALPAGAAVAPVVAGGALYVLTTGGDLLAYN